MCRPVLKTNAEGFSTVIRFHHQSFSKSIYERTGFC